MDEKDESFNSFTPFYLDFLDSPKNQSLDSSPYFLTFFENLEFLLDVALHLTCWIIKSFFPIGWDMAAMFFLHIL